MKDIKIKVKGKEYKVKIEEINGKIKDRLEISTDTDPGKLEELALGQPKIKDALRELNVRKVIPVGNKLVNIVAAN